MATGIERFGRERISMRFMLRSLSRCSALILMTGFAALPAPAGAVTFDDGLVHVIDAGGNVCGKLRMICPDTNHY